MNSTPKAAEAEKCICGTCNTFQKAKLTDKLFCRVGKVGVRVEEVECKCGGCPVFKVNKLNGIYFCSRIQDKPKSFGEKYYLTLIAGYLVGILIALLAFTGYTYLYANFTPLIESLVYVGVSGALGALVYCIRGYYEHIAAGDFKINYSWWYVSHPMAGFVLGVFAYFLIVGGLLTLGAETNASTQNILFYCAISFLAGFALRQFLTKLNDIAKTVFSSEKHKEGEKKETKSNESEEAQEEQSEKKEKKNDGKP